MIIFKQKQFSEYDAMRQLYVALEKIGAIHNRTIGVIDTSALIPILKGNNIVIEKFTQAPRIFGKDRYRMYLKIGARAKMPDEVRLPQYSRGKSLGNLQLELNYGFFPDNNGGGNKKDKEKKQEQQPSLNSTSGPNDRKKKEDRKEQKNASETTPSVIFRQKEFGNGPKPVASVSFRPNVDFLRYEIHSLLGDALKYDKRDRSLVLEFSTIEDAIRALNILPFGLGYKLYLLNA